jgi:predicted nucleic acid-binding Zn ribbon protein
MLTCSCYVWGVFFLQAYVAPTALQAIDASGVVTETQIKEDDRRRRRRYLLYAFGVFGILLIIVIVPVVITQNSSPATVEFVNITEASSSVPSASPTTTVFVELLSNIEQLYGDTDSDLYFEAMADEQSPQYKAAIWTADNAPEGIGGSDPRMISRYALATFYFSTNGDDWAVCSRGSTDCALENKWLSAENECNWYAVECEDPSNGDYNVLSLDFRK